jgi:hypothetical protein
MTNLIEISEIEAAALIGLTDRTNVLPLRFGGNRAWLDLDTATNTFTDHLKKMRRERSTVAPPACGGPDV